MEVRKGDEKSGMLDIPNFQFIAQNGADKRS